jgi:hypothetical protein
VSSPRTRKVKPLAPEDARRDEQRQELEAIHGKLRARGVDDGESRKLMQATEERGGFEGRQVKRVSDAKRRLLALEAMLQRRHADHARLHRLLDTECCASISKCAAENAEEPLGHDAATIMALGRLGVAAGFQKQVERSRLRGTLGAPGRDSVGGVVAFLVDEGQAGSHALSYREVALLRLEARAVKLPFTDERIEDETEAVKKARSEYGLPPRARARRSAGKPNHRTKGK